MFNLFKRNKKVKEKSVIKDLLKNPDKFIFKAYVENETLTIKVKRKETEEL